MRQIMFMLVGCAALLFGACGDDSVDRGGSSDGVGNDGDVVGGSCDPGDCASGSYCEQSGSFPGGVCTFECNDHDDCPSGTRCISNQGGICLLRCDEDRDCRNGYSCDRESDEEGGGESFVCTD